MSTETPTKTDRSPSLVREFEHWTLTAGKSPEPTLVLADRAGARGLPGLSEKSLRQMLTVVRVAENALMKVRGSRSIDCRWVTSREKQIQIHLTTTSGPPSQDDAEPLVDLLRREIPEQCAPFERFGRVYTTGCFDLFHVGHLNIIRASRAIADELVVGVSTDELIESEKGTRPSVPLEDRMAIVAAIRHVDRVIPQTDKNKQRIVDEYGIDAITVGSDWKGRYPSVTCELVFFPYTDHTSSSRLKDEIASLARA